MQTIPDILRGATRQNDFFFSSSDGWMNEYISLDRTDAIFCCRRETGTAEKRTQAQGISIILFTTVLVCRCHINGVSALVSFYLQCMQLGRNAIQCVWDLFKIWLNMCVTIEFESFACRMHPLRISLVARILSLCSEAVRLSDAIHILCAWKCCANIYFTRFHFDGVHFCVRHFCVSLELHWVGCQMAQRSQFPYLPYSPISRYTYLTFLLSRIEIIICSGWKKCIHSATNSLAHPHTKFV